MGTITITAAGFSVLSLNAPANWPAGVVWPGDGATVAPNGSKVATITDAEMLQLLTWIASGHASNPPATVTVTQLLVSWVATFFNGTKSAIQQYFTVPTAPPPPIGLN